MGMYTGLRVKAFVKEEFREMIDEINNGSDWNDYAEQYPFLKDYGQLSRAEFIPRGALAYMPDSWEEGVFPNLTDTDGFDRKIDMNTGYWTFQCSLKNYGSEIEQFFDEILPHIIESAEHIEYYYEEWSRSKFFDFVDGKVSESSNEGIKYGLEDSYDNWGY